jgi:hypothetical protein
MDELFQTADETCVLWNLDARHKYKTERRLLPWDPHYLHRKYKVRD